MLIVENQVGIRRSNSFIHKCCSIRIIIDRILEKPKLLVTSAMGIGDQYGSSSWSSELAVKIMAYLFLFVNVGFQKEIQKLQAASTATSPTGFTWRLRITSYKGSKSTHHQCGNYKMET